MIFWQVCAVGDIMPTGSNFYHAQGAHGGLIPINEEGRRTVTIPFLFCVTWWVPSVKRHEVLIQFHAGSFIHCHPSQNQSEYLLLHLQHPQVCHLECCQDLWCAVVTHQLLGWRLPLEILNWNLLNNGINFTSSTVNTTNIYWFKPHYMFQPLKGYFQMFLGTQLITEL